MSIQRWKKGTCGRAPSCPRFATSCAGGCVPSVGQSHVVRTGDDTVRPRATPGDGAQWCQDRGPGVAGTVSYGKRGYGFKSLATDLDISFDHRGAVEAARVAAGIVLRACAPGEIVIEGWLQRVDWPIIPSSSASLQREGNASKRSRMNPNLEGPQSRCATPRHVRIPTGNNADAFWILQPRDRHHHRNASPPSALERRVINGTAGTADFSDAICRLLPSCKERSRERTLREARLRTRGPFSGGRSRPADVLAFVPRPSRLATNLSYEQRHLQR